MAKTLYVRPGGQHSTANSYGVGQVEFDIVAFEDGNPAYQKSDGSGNLGMSLTHLRNLFGADEGEIVDPFKQERYPISLKPWVNSDQDKTFLHFSFHFIPG